MTDRRSYSNLSRLPAWVLYDENNEVVASTRASTVDEAMSLFKQYKLKGAYVRRNLGTRQGKTRRNL